MLLCAGGPWLGGRVRARSSCAHRGIVSCASRPRIPPAEALMAGVWGEKALGNMNLERDVRCLDA